MNYLLTLLYHSNIKPRFFVSFSAQVFFALSEFLIFSFSPLIRMLWHNNNNSEDMLLMLSKFISFFLLGIIKIFWKHKSDKKPTQYSIFLLTTPIACIFSMIAIPLPLLPDNLYYLFFISYMSLIILNAVNYFLLDNMLHTSELEIETMRLNQQIL